MSKEIEERKRKLKENIQTFRNKEQELHNLQAKKRQLETGGVDLQSVQKAKTRKSQTLIDFILGRAAKTDIHSADMELSEAERDERLAVEMMEAIEDTIKKTEPQIKDIHNAVNIARLKLWESIYDQFKREAQAAVGNLTIMAIAAGSRCSRSHDDVMRDIFGSTSIAENDSAAKKLEAEFDIKF